MTNETKPQPRGAQEQQSRFQQQSERLDALRATQPRVELDEEAMAGWARADGGKVPVAVPDWVKRL